MLWRICSSVYSNSRIESNERGNTLILFHLLVGNSQRWHQCPSLPPRHRSGPCKSVEADVCLWNGRLVAWWYTYGSK